MNTINIYLTFMIVLLSSCAKLNMHEIRSMDKRKFDDLHLYADSEPNELRIDIIRKINYVYIDEGNYIEEPVPYHPLGMNLGNGIFYDLNGNLSLRLDHIMDFSANHPFEIKKNIKPKNNKNIYVYTFINEALTITRMPQNSSRNQYYKIEDLDSTAFLKKDRFLYSITDRDSSMKYQFKGRKPIEIHKKGNGRYYINKFKKNRECILTKNLVSLANDIAVQASEDKKTVIINSIWRERNNKKPLYYIEKNERVMFIYSSKGYGKKIEFLPDGIYLTGTNLKPIKCELTTF